MPVLSRRKFTLAVTSLLGAGLTGCGTLMYPERRGQLAGPLDWKVVAFDALGLLLFFIPGVIAFAVDFSTGAIYLPAGGYAKGSSDGRSRELVRVDVPPDHLTRDEIERVASQYADRRVRLERGQYETRELEDITHFWDEHDAITAR